LDVTPNNKMDYLDDLDQEAMNAFGELNDNTVPLNAAAAPELSPELKDLLRSTKKFHIPTEGVTKRRSSNMDYLFKIRDPITPTTLASAAILSSQPRLIQGEGEDGITHFCQVRDIDIPKIKSWLATTYPSISPVFAPINKARKTLSPDSAYPTLGYDTTLPHHRPPFTSRSKYRPAQDQYPVWYFFYGTLANASLLDELFGSPPEEAHVLVQAWIRGGEIRTWGSKYKALVDSTGHGSHVAGWAYKVVSKEQEDALCMYETAKYEVVRTMIGMAMWVGGLRAVKGCTFRFAGEEHELD
jgi:hypothetical protein